MEKPGRLQSTGSQRVRHDCATSPSPSPSIAVFPLSTYKLLKFCNLIMLATNSRIMVNKEAIVMLFTQLEEIFNILSLGMMMFAVVFFLIAFMS